MYKKNTFMIVILHLIQFMVYLICKYEYRRGSYYEDN